ncbi:MAG: nitrous oxide reductase family maturation protein NosD, partial [Actinomycetota bacterium]
MRRGAALVAVLVLGVTASALDAFSVARIGLDDDAAEMLSTAPSGAVVFVEPGSYTGPWSLDRSLVLYGDGVTVRAPKDAVGVTVSAPSRVSGLRVTGGESGIVVRETNGVVLEDVTVTGAELHGIEIVDASALVSRAVVDRLVSPYAQGIEIRNADGRPDSAVVDSTVIGGQEGIVSHVSEVLLEGNSVSHTSLRGIVVTEMSDGWVRRNRVSGASGVGLYCGDMSRCEFSRNVVERVEAGEGGASSAGWGLVVNYHASASSHRDELSGEAGPTATFIGSRLTDRSPLEPGIGSRAVWPALTAGLVAIVVLATVFLLVRHRWALPRPPSLTAPIRTALTVAVVTGIAVQSFHMSEHILQVFRVKVDGVPSRGGIVGPVVEAEVIHFLYNAAVLALMAFTWYGRRHGWGPGVAVRADRLLVAGVLLQGYHWFEHSLKLAQHVITGAKVNPGVAGNFFDL